MYVHVRTIHTCQTKYLNIYMDQPRLLPWWRQTADNQLISWIWGRNKCIVFSERSISAYTTAGRISIYVHKHRRYPCMTMQLQEAGPQLPIASSKDYASSWAQQPWNECLHISKSTQPRSHQPKAQGGKRGCSLACLVLWRLLWMASKVGNGREQSWNGHQLPRLFFLPVVSESTRLNSVFREILWNVHHTAYRPSRPYVHTKHWEQ